MEAERPHPLTEALAVCRRVFVAVALFSACVNLLMLTVPMYMLQVYDRVLTTGNVDTLLALSAMVVVGLATFGLLDAVRLRILARVGVWLDRELGSPVLAGAVAEARRSGGGGFGPGTARLDDATCVSRGRGHHAAVRRTLVAGVPGCRLRDPPAAPAASAWAAR